MTKKNKTAIYFFRKDLRLKNNKVIDLMIQEEYTILPVYLWDEENLKKEKRCSNFRDFLAKSLFSLEKEIASSGGRLLVVKGSMKRDACSLIDFFAPDKVFMQKLYLPWEKEEEKYITETCPGLIDIVPGNYLLFEPGEVVKKDGSSYSVFTPFYKEWRRKILEDRLFFDGKSNRKPRFSDPQKADSYDNSLMPDLAKFKADIYSDCQKKIAAFLKEKIQRYQIDRDFPCREGTSELSRYINIGIVSAKEVVSRCLADDAGFSESEPFIRQLAWRDFYYHVYHYNPYVLNRAFKKKYAEISWEYDQEKWRKWKAGLTGYPFIDAGMRQLEKEGFMHNRLRMAVASFLTKDLLINWQKGEAYFMDKLVDGDLVLNNGGWQWSASTGADAQPYFRIFNPVLQSRKFDSKGEYIRRYVPELANVPEKFVHEPWKMSGDEQKKYGVVIGKDYPEPLVDHKEQRLKALELYTI